MQQIALTSRRMVKALPNTLLILAPWTSMTKSDWGEWRSNVPNESQQEVKQVLQVIQHGRTHITKSPVRFGGSVFLTDSNGTTPMMIFGEKHPTRANQMTIPGGHLDWGESPIATGVREMVEEMAYVTPEVLHTFKNVTDDQWLENAKAYAEKNKLTLVEDLEFHILSEAEAHQTFTKESIVKLKEDYPGCSKKEYSVLLTGEIDTASLEIIVPVFVQVPADGFWVDIERFETSSGFIWANRSVVTQGFGDYQGTEKVETILDSLIKKTEE